MIIDNIPTLKLNKLTKEQYNRELNAGTIDENALYLVSEPIVDYIPVPAHAKVGQTVCVSEVDETGKPLSWRVVDSLNGKLVHILDYTFEEDVDAEADWGIEDAVVGGRHFWQTTVDGEPFKLIRGWVIINWGAGSKTACTLQPAPSFCFAGEPPTNWATGEDGCYTTSRGSISNSIISDETPVLYGIADLTTLSNFSFTQSNPAWASYTFSFLQADRIWESKNLPYFDTFKFHMRGTVKAGTRIRVFGETGQVRG